MADLTGRSNEGTNEISKENRIYEWCNIDIRLSHGEKNTRIEDAREAIA